MLGSSGNAVVASSPIHPLHHHPQTQGLSLAQILPQCQPLLPVPCPALTPLPPPPRGYLYAGLEFGAECYCGHKVQAPNASESECNMECKGERSSTCGGANHLSIYRLELAQESARRCESTLPENGDPTWGVKSWCPHWCVLLGVVRLYEPN